MEKPRIRHIAINVEDLDKTAEYYKRVFGMEEKHRRPGGTIYLSDGHLDLALIHTEKYPWGIHHFGFKVDSVKEIEKIADTKAEDNTYGAIAESWIKDVEGNRVDVSEHGWPVYSGPAKKTQTVHASTKLGQRLIGIANSKPMSRLRRKARSSPASVGL